MPSLGIREVLFILLIVALIFGAKRLPQMARGLGTGIRNFRGSLRAPEGDDPGDPEDPGR